MADATSRAKFLLEADTRQYAEELAKAQRQQKSFAAELRGGLGGAFTAVASAAAAVGVGIGGTIAQAVAYADEIGNQANLLGVASDKLIAYRFAAEDAGSSAEKFDKALRESQRILAEGGKEVSQWTQKLGLSMADLRRQSPDELFATYSDAISRLNTRGEQFAAVQALMGGKAGELTGLVVQGSSALREAEEMTKRFGASLTDIEVEQIKQVDNSFDKAKLGAQGAANTVALAFGPAIEAIVTDFVEATAGSETFKKAVKLAAEAAYVGFRIVSQNIDLVQAALQGVVGTAIYAYSKIEELVGNSGGAAKLRATAQGYFDDAKANLQGLRTIEELRGDFEQLTLDSQRRAAEAATLRAQARDANRARANGASVAEDGDPFQLGKLGKLPKIDNQQAELDRLRILEEGKKGIRDEAYRAEVELQQRRVGMYAEAERSILDQVLSRHEYEINLDQVKNATLGESLSSFLQAFASHSKSIAKISQSLAIAQVVYQTARAVMQAAPNLGLMAKVAADGASQLALIKSTSFGGGGSVRAAGGSSGFSGVEALANFQQERQAAASMPGGAQQRPQLTIAFNGPVAGDRAFIDLIRKQLARDVTVIYGSNRQTADLPGLS